MVIIVADAAGPRLEEKDVFNRFHVRAGSAEEALSALGEDGRAAEEADHVWVRVDAVRGWAGGDAAWEEGFSKMIGFAAKHGWVDEAGTHVKAHVQAD
ncbi:MAG TPA: hypothetical protein RMG95_20865 [Polyangiaceae bacterium LLY-WYZ-15_(1-7)]|nr:hypothetical protein [Sandaracinus sp.]HJK92778.1 hypothetical protein [Polyangiaceae bacterium LLY-WYZ-15_(1-7)]HJL38162.1 hypothetical protein [Polyangiaceae bacterium LLY-WYZ-15_(1-7)]HJL50510.1 hypothetical protein [Polyangiaceae bacterium LLY-WYZ-15_(1-7)]